MGKYGWFNLCYTRDDPLPYIADNNLLLFMDANYQSSVTESGGTVDNWICRDLCSSTKLNPGNIFYKPSLLGNNNASSAIYTAWQGKRAVYFNTACNGANPGCSQSGGYDAGTDARILVMPPEQWFNSTGGYIGNYTLFYAMRASANGSGWGNACIISQANNNEKRRKLQCSVDTINVTYYNLEGFVNGNDNGDTYFEINTGTSPNNDTVLRVYGVSYFSDFNSRHIVENNFYTGAGISGESYALEYGKNPNDAGYCPVLMGCSPFQYEDNTGTVYNAEASGNMYIHEVLVYRGSMSDTNMQRIYNYLVNKWS